MKKLSAKPDAERINVHMHVRMTQEMREAFFAAAAKNDQSVSQLIRLYIRDYIKKHGDK